MSTSAKDKMFEGGQFKVDSEKNMYRMTEGGYTLIHKLGRPIYALTIYNCKAYFIDTFGDCYAVDDGVHFLFGILSNPMHFAVKNDRIYALDKYSRMWVHDMEGEILNVSFLKENICTVVVKELYCYATTDGCKLAIGHAVDAPRKERKVIICDRSFTILKVMEVNRVIEAGNDFIVYEACGKVDKLSIQSLWERIEHGCQEKISP